MKNYKWRTLSSFSAAAAQPYDQLGSLWYGADQKHRKICPKIKK
jgi:hypothetical protein